MFIQIYIYIYEQCVLNIVQYAQASLFFPTLSLSFLHHKLQGIHTKLNCEQNVLAPFFLETQIALIF
jgi:hypothetical protein